MILFNLKCANDHRFEAWFRNGDSFDRQAAAGEIQCPHCADQRVTKAPMAPNIHTRRGHAGPAAEPVAHQADDGAEAAASADEGGGALSSPEQQVLRQALETLHRAVVDNFDNVGRQFAEEARAIHDGTATKRGIYGEATVEEARELLEDGIPVLPLPGGRKLS